MEPILRPDGPPDWITIVLVISIFLAVIAKSLFYSKFMNFIILPFNNKYIVMYNKKDKLFNWFNMLFTGFQLLNFSLFVYFTIDLLFTSKIHIQPILYPVIFAVLFLFFFFKIVLQLGNGYVFNSNQTISLLIFKKLSYFNYSSIVMFLANVVLSYILPSSKTVLYVSFLLILLINGIGWATLVRNHQKFIVGNFFYFILYLCALEIGPFLLIGSCLKD